MTDSRRPPQLAEELDEVRMRGTEGEEALHLDARARRELRRRLVLLAPTGLRPSVDDLDLRMQEPACEVEVVRREIEAGASLVARWEGGEARVDVAHLPFPA